MTLDPLAISRGLALTDVGLAAAGLDRQRRLGFWAASLRAMAALEADLGVSGWLMPGAHLWVETLREGPVLCELGWPELPAGPAMMRWPIRRFGALAWELDGGAWAPLWWARVRERASLSAWDAPEDERQVGREIGRDFAEVWRRGSWGSLNWRLAPPGWVDRIFCAQHAAMKAGIRSALASRPANTDVYHLPVLAGGSQLIRATVAVLDDPKTMLFSPSEAGYRAFLDNVQRQGVGRGPASSMAFSWWGRHLDDERAP